MPTRPKADGVLILATARYGCGSPVIFSLQPGYEGARRGAIDLFTKIDKLIDRPVPDVLWCRACWSKRFTRCDVAV